VIGDPVIFARLEALVEEYEKATKGGENQFGLTLYSAQIELFVQRHYTERERFALKLKIPTLQRAIK
jgi:hypothetical protein